MKESLTGDSLYILGVLILTITSIPKLLEKGAGLPGLVVALIVISVGTSGVKASLPPFLGILFYLYLSLIEALLTVLSG